MFDARMMRTATLAFAALLLSPLLALSASALDPADYADPAFQRTWERTDKPVEDGAIPRTWVWGAPVTGAVEEPYVESPGQSRLVQYFDKTRMEITDPAGDQNAIWYVTNGLLVVELMTGLQQTGNNDFGIIGPAQVNVAGDPLDPDAVTYADLTALTVAPPASDKATITNRVDSNGVVTNDPGLASHGVTAAHRLTVPGIDHQIASVFWDYMNSTGLVWENGGYTTANLFPDPYYATGFPKTEPYWTNVDVGGVDTLVLLQCFERRCLTYTPTNAPEWRVEMGNVGSHYHTWRYTPLPPADPNVLFVAYLNGVESPPGAPAPKREPNAEPVPSGIVSIALVPHPGNPVNDIEVQVSTANAGTPTGYELRFGPPGAPQAVILSRDLSASDDLLATDRFGPAELELAGIPSFNAFLHLLYTGLITVVVQTQDHPEGAVSGALAPIPGPEVALRAELVSIVDTASFGNAAFYHDPESGEIEYSILAFGQDITGAYIALGSDPGTIVVDLTTPVLGVPTSGSFDEDDLEGSFDGQPLLAFVQELVNGDANIVVTTAAHSDGELGGRSEIMDPRHEQLLWFFVMNGNNMAPAVNTTGRGTGVLTWTNLDEMDFLVTSADLPNVTGVELREGVRGENGSSVLSLMIADPPSGEINGVLGEWIIRRDELEKQGTSFEEFAYRVEAQRIYALQTTDAEPNGAIRGQGQFPYTLEPVGLYLAQLYTDECQEAMGRHRQADADDTIAAPANHGCGPSITIMLFHAANPQGYSDDAVSWDMYCDGVDAQGGARIRREGEGTVLAELVPKTPSDAENANGFCGTGAITKSGEGDSEPWEGDDDEWPPDGWENPEDFFIEVDPVSGKWTQVWTDD